MARLARYLSIPANAAATFLQPSAFKCRLSGSAMPGCLNTVPWRQLLRRGFPVNAIDASPTLV
ncbi:MAG: hypothetical protein ACRD9W_14995, partial [Terriglobia bacterium]